MSTQRDLTSGGRLARNSALNLFGTGVPMIVAFVAIPLLIGGLGAERFGILTIAWTTIGYFNVFDLGLGRALTHLVAERLGTGREREIPSLAWSALALMLLLGILGAVALLAIAPWLIGHALKVPVSLQAESLSGFRLLAFALPWVITTSALRGILEANQSFGLVNAIRVPLGIVTYAAPLAVLPFSNRLVPIIGALVVCRILAWFVHLAFCFRALPILRSSFQIDRALLGPLARFGGWMTASNVASSIMVYLDRFMIGAAISMAAVTFYVTPYEAVTKLWIVPGALISVLFPAMSASYAHDRIRTEIIVDRAFRAIFLSMFPIVLLTVAFAHEGLNLWLAPEFAERSTRVLQILAVGVLVNSIGMIPAAGLQGVGRPKITGMLNLLELPLYLAVLWWLLRTDGIEGAAIAWLARVVVDTALLSVLADRAIQGRALTRQFFVWLVPGVFALAAVAIPSGIAPRAMLAGGVFLVFVVAGWSFGIRPAERAAVRRFILPTTPVPRGTPS